MGSDDLARKQQYLQRLEQESTKVNLEIERYYQRLFQAFEQRYPPLKRVQEIHVSQDMMKKWIYRQYNKRGR
jgi:predicted chitinase